ncbi:hypothetical protein [Saliterribacillus persicus]|uniref:Uncharacterized protein n=1 Tax=Saliterribacillus persicus TaxID=930114 RepID=A0A368YD58_9BACI|nr:hypothetical protein [Saliterribacillus persicus]RCW76807.1 hypothetical protein DFR57_10282 [Saliterribacillus persicus]
MIAIIIFSLCASVLIGLWTRVHQVEVENTELLEKYKGEHRDEYFVNIDGEEIHVEKHVWYLVEANETYNIEYKWSHYHGAKLIHIEKSD